MDYEGLVGLSSSPTPICSNGGIDQHLSLDQACLEVKNDYSFPVEIWAQSQECYECLPWYFLTVIANQTQSLIVNSTYPTDVYIRDTDGIAIQSFSYHFGQYGKYSKTLDESESSVNVLQLPNQEILPVIMTIVYFTLLALVWQFGKCILRKMDSPSELPRPIPSSESTTQLVSKTSVTTELESEPRPGPSNAVENSGHTETNDSAPVLVVQPQEVPDSRRTGGRLVSLDVFRGTAIIIMVFVNYGGGKYYFFKHARWNGLTVADLVFPWFLWIMGVSLAFSIRSQLRRATKRSAIVFKILKRCIILFALGIIINSKSSNYLPTFRILGVLQRFAFCYLFNAIIEVYCMSPQQSPEYVWYWKVRDIVRSWPQWFLTILVVCAHTLITFMLPVPGCPKGYLGPGGLHHNGTYKDCTGGAAGYIDRLVLGTEHMYGHPTCMIIYDTNTPYDPEGLLGILTSILMVQFGVAAGRIIITHKSHLSRLIRWLIWGTATGIVAAGLCGLKKEGGTIPVNKNLWSLSYVFTTTCFAFYLLSIFYLFVDKLSWWSGNPIRYVGMNAILIYMGHEILGNLLPWSWSPVGSYHVDYLVMNVWGTCLWVVIAYIFHCKKTYISI